MPRRNKSLQPKRQLPDSTPDSNKKTYRSRREAENAIRAIRVYDPDIELSAYRSLSDGLWRLTSKRPNK